MSLTTAELKRIRDLEETVIQLAQLVKGGGSKNQLNRLNVLAQKKLEDARALLESCESTLNKILELVRKLQ